MDSSRFSLVNGHADKHPGCLCNRGAVIAATTVLWLCFRPGIAGQAYLAESWWRSMGGLNATYTIVNKADGRRIVASAEAGFSLVEGGLWPILADQMWHFVPMEVPESAGRQVFNTDNGCFSIVNAASGVRLFAKSGANMEREFGAIDDGPVYQDQRWWLAYQRDGSFGIINSKNGRRITSVGQAGIAAVTAIHIDAPIEDAQRWWLINQRQDETGHCLFHARWQEQALETHGVQLASLASQLHSCEAGRRNDSTASTSTQVACAAASVDVATSVHAETVQCLGIACADDDKMLEPLPIPWFDNRIAIAAAASTSIGLIMLWGSHKLSKLHVQLGRKQQRIDALEHEFREELVGMVRIGDAAAGELGFDFGFRILDREVGQETVRLIKIQCPGVEHADVEVELIFNGCIVSLRRRASCGVEAATWRRRFQFRPSDGLFEFKEDQMTLERGYLQLFFRAYRFQSRVIRFPQHYSLAESDSDQYWDYPVYSELHPGPALELRRPESAKLVATSNVQRCSDKVPGVGCGTTTTLATPAAATALIDGAVVTAGDAVAHFEAGTADSRGFEEGEDEASAAASVDATAMQAAQPEKTCSHLADTESTASTAR